MKARSHANTNTVLSHEPRDDTEKTLSIMERKDRNYEDTNPHMPLSLADVLMHHHHSIFPGNVAVLV